MDPAAVVDLLLTIIQGNGATFKTIDKSQIPPKASAALRSWSSSNNIPIDEPDTNSAFYEIDLIGDLGSAYVADYDGDDPDQFRATAIIKDGKIIGQSIAVGS